jgi:hypothetical protein
MQNELSATKIRDVSYYYAKDLIKAWPIATKEWLIQRAFWQGVEYAKVNTKEAKHNNRKGK